MQFHSTQHSNLKYHCVSLEAQKRHFYLTENVTKLVPYFEKLKDSTKILWKLQGEEQFDVDSGISSLEAVGLSLSFLEMTFCVKVVKKKQITKAGCFITTVCHTGVNHNFLYFSWQTQSKRRG